MTMLRHQTAFPRPNDHQHDPGPSAVITRRSPGDPLPSHRPWRPAMDCPDWRRAMTDESSNIRNRLSFVGAVSIQELVP